MHHTEIDKQSSNTTGQDMTSNAKMTETKEDVSSQQLNEIFAKSIDVIKKKILEQKKQREKGKTLGLEGLGQRFPLLGLFCCLCLKWNKKEL